MYKTIFSFTVLAISIGFCDDATLALENKTQEAPSNDIAKVSEAFGHMIGKNLESMGVKVDIQYVIKGLKDAAAGKDSPMTELECIEAISHAQETAFLEQSKVNLEQAEAFLKKNAEASGVISLENGKVLYKVEKEGSGAAVNEECSPLIRYMGKFIDGTVFGSSNEDELLFLEEIIPGLRQGLIGMKEGEKRIIHIHPDFAYKTSGSLPPNSLLTFEVELIKANSEKAQEEDHLIYPSDSSHEIALPEGSFEAIR